MIGLPGPMEVGAVGGDGAPVPSHGFLTFLLLTAPSLAVAVGLIR